MVKAAGLRLKQHRLGRLLQRDEHADLRVRLAVERAAQIADVFHADLAAFDLHDHPFRVCAGIVMKCDDAVNAGIRALFALLALRVAAVRTRRHQADRPPLELIAVNGFGQMPRSGEVFRLADNRVAAIPLDVEGVFEAVFDVRDGEMRHVNAEPRAAQFLRGVNRRAAAAERVKHDVAFVAAGLNDALQERERLLCRVAETLLIMRTERLNISP